MGWGLAQMWYDKFVGLPPHGSLLETIFVLVRLHRQQAELMSTRALVQSIVGMHESKAATDPAIKAFQEYCAKVFPFIDRAMDSDAEKSRLALEAFVRHNARIDLKPIYKSLVQTAGRAAARRFKLKPKDPGIR